MSLLSAEGVSKRYRRGRREVLALEDASFVIDDRELAVVLGTRSSGRSTLLRIAAGVERPDSGVVRFEGRDLWACSDPAGRKIAYCHTSFSATDGERVLDQVAAPLLARRLPRAEANRAAESALERTSVSECAEARPEELNGSESIRVAIARGLAAGPRMLVIDDPTTGVGLLQIDSVLRLLGSLAGADGYAVLMSTDDAMCISGADRVLSLDDGRLRAEVRAPEADVLPFRPRRVRGGQPGC